MMEQDKKRILIINDEKEMLEQIKRWLIIAGYMVQCTLTAENGIRMLNEDKFDLILLDYHLKAERTGAKTAKTFIPLFKNLRPSIPICCGRVSIPNCPVVLAIGDG